MHTPFRLAATLARLRLAQSFSRKKHQSPLRRVVIPHLAQEIDAAKLVGVAGRPIVWLTCDADPLTCKAIGKVTRAVQKSASAVFLVTDALLLRQRVHEFTPSAEFYFAVRLYGPPALHDRRMHTAGAFARAMEGMRAAQLSGFLICAHIVVEPQTELHEVSQLLEHLCSVNLDGVIITAENDASKPQRETAAVARTLIGNRWWSSFSRLLQFSFDEPQDGAPRALPHAVAGAAGSAGSTSAITQTAAKPRAQQANDAAGHAKEVATQ